MNIKHIIELGNCRTGVNESIYNTIEEGPFRADSTLKTADNTVLTADYDL